MLNKLILFIVLTLFVLIAGFVVVNYLFSDKQPVGSQNMISPENIVKKPRDKNKPIRYIPVGDSYTIGNGVAEVDRWPNMLVKHLQEQGIAIALATNPAVTGFTVQDALDKEISVIQKERPDFVTVLLGANDVYQRLPEEVFKKNYLALLDLIQKNMDDPTQIVLINIPDFGKSHAGQYQGRDIPVYEIIQRYNQIIAQEAKARGLKVVDLFSVSQEMDTPDYYVSDGLHPNAKGYAKWEAEIFKTVYELLK